jgi:Sensors of blue-light using FAD
MYFLTYVSAAVSLFTNEQLRDLLVVCERNNRRDEITGLLLYKDGNFMQVLEGTEAVVRQAHERIASDPRHGGLITLLQGPQGERQFPDWSMGFRDLGTTSLKPAGYSEFLNSPLTGREFAANPSRAQKLLLTFKKTS